MSAVMEFVVTLAIACGIVYLIARRNREKPGNAPLRSEITVAGVGVRGCFAFLPALVLFIARQLH